MHRQILLDGLPYLAVMAAAVLALRALVWLSGARLQWRQLWSLHRDQAGGVQSLSFVLTVPLFIWIMMLIVQVSQLMIARVVLEYAAFAAARSAIVWIPADVGLDEPANRILSLYPQFDLTQMTDVLMWPEHSLYEVGPPLGIKYGRIRLAAVTACLPICPSRDLALPADDPADRDLAAQVAPALLAAYADMLGPGAPGNSRIPARLANKLNYALQHTRVYLQVRHNNDKDPPLVLHEFSYVQRDDYMDTYNLAWRGADGHEEWEFEVNEIGFQDQVLVTVEHDFALLPGPGRLLSRTVRTPPRPGDISQPDSEDRMAQRIGWLGESGTYVWPLSATVVLSNLGEKSVLPYYQN